MKKRSGWRLLRRYVAVVLVLGLVGGGIAVWWSVRSTPTWYQPPARTDAVTIERAEAVEYRIAEEAHRLREADEVWTLVVEEREINAWLATRLPEWMQHAGGSDWPVGLGIPQVRLVDGAIDLGLSVSDGERVQLLVARVQPTITGDRIALAPRRIGLGRMSVPVDSMDGLLNVVRRAGALGFHDGSIDEAVTEVGRVLEEGIELQTLEDGTGEPLLDLIDGRRIEVIGLDTGPGGVLVDCRTRPRE